MIVVNGEYIEPLAANANNIKSSEISNRNLFVHIKTSNNSIYATNTQELIDELKKHIDDKIIRFENYDSIIDMIKDDYMHNDVCMVELIRSTWVNKVDFEDITVLLHWAGEEDCLHDFADKEE